MYSKIKFEINNVLVKDKEVVRIDYGDQFKLFWKDDFLKMVRESKLDFNPFRKDE